MDTLNLEIGGGQKIYFSSDQHFGHKNVLRFCQRPYETTKEMGKALIDNWNSKVTNNDIIFVLGDFFWFHGRHEIKKVVDKLNGKTIYIVPGNHCKRTAYELCDERVQLLDDISALYIREVGKPQVKYEVYVSHMPLMTWPHRERGSYNFFGHIHSGPRSLSQVDQDLPFHKGLQYDIGVDNNEYTPIELEEIINILKKEP